MKSSKFLNRPAATGLIALAMALVLGAPFTSADPVSVTSEEFDVIPAAAAKFVFTVNPVNPATTKAGETTTFTVQTLDEHGNVTNDHGGFENILTVTGATAFAAGFTQVDFPATPNGADPFNATYSLHTFTVCFRLAGEYTLTVDAPGMESVVHEITVEPSILWKPVTATSVTYMDNYSQILYAYDPVNGPVFNYSATGLPPGLSIGTSFDFIDTIAGSVEVEGEPSGEPRAVAVAPDGTVYFTDSKNGMVRKRATDGTVTTVYTDAESGPWGIAADANYVYFTKAANSSVVRLDRSGGSYTATNLITSGLFVPFGLALDGSKLYIADTFNQKVKVYDLTLGTLTDIAGTGSAGYNGDEIAATTAQLNFPEAVAVGPDGNIYIADTSNNRIRMVNTTTGLISTIAGIGFDGFDGDGGLATAARIQGSTGIAVDSAGRILISDTQNNRLRLIRADGNIETIAGTATSGFSGDGGDASDAKMLIPGGVAIGPDMSIYVADTGNSRIRQIYLSVAVLSGKPEDVNRDGATLVPYNVTLNANPGTGCGVDYLFDLDVQPKELNVINAVAENKTYDATTDAVVSGAELSGIEAPGGTADTVTLTNATVGVFERAGVGSELEVTTSMGLAGDHAYRYTIAQPDDLEAEIFERRVTYVVDGDQGKVYGETDNDDDLTGVVDPDAGHGLVSGHAFTTGSLVRVAGEDVGNYAIKKGTLQIRDGDNNDVTPNYDLTFVSDDFLITQRPLSIVATGATKVYGDSDPAFLFTNEPALQWGDVFVGALSRDAGQNVDSYDFLIGTLTIEDGDERNVAHNYDISFDGTTNRFTITPAMLTVTANDDSKIYDALAYSGGNDVDITGFQFGDDRTDLDGTLTFSGSSQGAVNQGTYAITPGGYSSNNYEFTYVNGQLTILRRALTITANDRSKTYGDTITLGTSAFTTNGNEAGSEVVTSVVLTAQANADSNPNAPVGGYDITPSGATSTGGFVADNYDITYTDGTLTIGTRAITITANNQGKIYGNELTIPNTDFTLGGTLAPDETVATVVLTVEDNAALNQNANVGTYGITPSGAAGSGFVASNYAITYELGTLTVDQRPLTITADNRTKLYGEVLVLGTSDFSLSSIMAPILAPGEEVTSVTLTSDGSAEKAPVADSPYAIHTANASGTGGFDVANYDITYSSDGTLMIDPRVITVIADNQSKTFGETHNLGTTDFTVTGQTLVDEPIQSVTLTSTGTALCADVEDSHPIIASSPTGDDFNPGNYVISFENGLLTVTKADQEILYTDIEEPVEWTFTFPLQATRSSASGCDAPASIVFDATAPGFVAGTDLTFNMRGPVTVTASLAGDANYNAAADVTQTIIARAAPVWESTAVTSGTVCHEYSYQLAVSDLDGWRWSLSIHEGTPDWLDIYHDASERRIHLLAGNGIAGSADGASVIDDDFPAHSASFNRPYGLAVAADMTVYVADRDNHVVRRIDPWGTVTVIAGTVGTNGFAGDGAAATAAQLSSPRGVFLDAAEQNLYIADTANHRIRRVDLTSGIITTVAGNGLAGIGTIGENVNPTSTRLDSPYAIVGTADTFYIASAGLHRIRKLVLNEDPAENKISTLVGAGINNPLNTPTGLFLEGDTLYIADRGRQRIASYDVTATTPTEVTNVAGTAGTSGFSGDGGAATSALLNQPYSIAVANGILYITDANNHRIRAVNLGSGNISTLVGDGTGEYLGENELLAGARIDSPRTIIPDGHGHLLFADMNNHRIRRIDNGTFYLEGTPSQAGDYVVTLHADDGFFTSAQTFTIEVEKDMPTIDVLPSITGITYGDLLTDDLIVDGEATNSCGAVIAGTFTWETGGLLLAAGTHTRTIVFTPDNTDDYETQTASVSITVDPKVLTVTALADPASIVYGDDAPYVLVEYAGFIAGEDASVLSNTGFTLGTDYEPGNPIGTYNTTIAVGTAAADNYTFDLQTSTFEVTRRVLVVTFEAVDRVYDGTTDVTVFIESDNRFGRDDITFDFTAAFADKFADNNKTVHITGISLGGTSADNYTLAATEATTTANITPRTLNIEFAGVSRTYDATDVATVTATDDRISGDVFDILRTATFTVGKDVGENKNIDITDVSLDGTDAINYTLSFNATTTATISRATLTVSGAEADDKIYNGSNAATISGASLVGVLLSDVVSLVSPAVGTFAQATIGTNILVTAALAIEGADAHNYDLVQPTGLSADITARPLNVTFTAQDRIYNGTTNVEVTTSDDRVSGDVLTVNFTAAFADKFAGNNKPVNITDISLSGADSGNYTVDATATTTANITPRTLNIVFTGVSRTYDATDVATVTATDDRVADDEFTILRTATFTAGKNVGENKNIDITDVSLTGTDAINYSVSFNPTTSATISRATLTVSGAEADDKIYNGSNAATISGASLVGVLLSDVVSLVSPAVGTFAQATIGTNILVTAALAIEGADAHNYDLVQPTGLSADITARPLNVTFTAQDRIYNGTTNVEVTTSDDRVDGDALTVNFTAAFADKNAGDNKTVNITGISLSGADAFNYTVDATATTYADITRRTLNITFAGVDRDYDGGIVATVTATDDRVENDVLEIVRTAAFRDKHAGENKPVDITDVSLTGLDAGNYTVAFNAETTATIHPRSLLLSDFVADNKIYDGTTTVLSGAGFSDDRVTGDVLEFTYDVAFEDKNVGTDKDVLFTNIVISGGADKDNYELANTSGTAQANITARPLMLSNFVADSKTYDGNRNVLSGAGFEDDRVSEDDLDFAFTALFDTRNAGTDKDVDFTGIAISGGADKDNYNLVTTTGTAKADIDPLELTIGGSFTAQSKTYDRTESVDINPAGLTLQTPVTGDSVSLVSVDAEFVSVLAGTGVTVRIISADLSGDDKDNYTLSLTGVPESAADILRKELTIIGLTGDSRIYDGTTDAAASGTAMLDGVISPDEVTITGTPVFTFADKNVATGIEITTTGYGLGGEDANNYSLTQPVLSADITPLPIAITPDANQSKIAGNADPVFTFTASPALLGGDTFTGALSRENAGGHTAGQFDYLIGSLDAGNNYALSIAGTEQFTVNPNDPFALTIDQIDSDTREVISPATGGVAGESIPIRVTAVDAWGNVATSYNGLRRLRLSGPSDSLLGDKPVYTEDIVEGVRQTIEFDASGPAILQFTNGVFETEMDLVRAETVTISGFSTTSNSDFQAGRGFRTSDEPGYPLEINVLPAAASYLVWEVEPQKAPAEGDAFTVVFDAVWDDFSVRVYDRFGNFRDTDTSAVSLAVTNQVSAPANASFANESLLTVNAVEGIATFSGLIYRDPAALATLTFVAESAGLTSTVASTPVEVLPASVDFTIAADQTRPYTGTGFVPVVTVDPGVSFSITYFAGADADVETATPLAGAPVTVGAYTFLVEITDPRYEGSATANMSITPVTLTVTADNKSKPYDGETFSDFTYSVTGFVNDEDDSVISGAVTFTGAAVSAINAGEHVITPVVTGLSATNYVFEPADGTLTIHQVAANINTFPVTAVYDGQSVMGNVTARGVEMSPANLSGLLTIGSISKVAQSGTVVWNFAGNINYLPDSGTTEVTITRRELSIAGSFTAGNKVYDQSTVATITDSNGLSLTPVVSGDDVSLTGLQADFASALAGTHSVALTAADLTGADANNYSVTLAGSPTTEATILRGALTLSGSFTAANKVYDGLVGAVLVTNNLVLSAALGSDEVALDSVTLAFASRDVADGKTVSIVAATLSGADAANYEVDLTAVGTPTAMANITARPLFVTGTFTAQNKTYDRTNSAEFLSNDLSIDSWDVVGSDEVSLGAVTLAFADANVATGIQVSITGALLEGADAGNYRVDLTGSPTATADIEAVVLTVGGSFTAADKIYDGHTMATIVENNLALVGILVEGDLDDVMIADWNLAFASATVAGSPHTVSITGIELGGAQAGNYEVDLTGAPTAQASITALELTIGGVLAAADKDYDQSTSVVLDTTGLTLVTPVSGDSVALANVVGEFASPGAGSVAVSITGAQLAGADASNYSLSLAGAPETTATIRSITLTPSNFVADSKTYDATTDVTGAAFSDNRLSGDELEFTFDVAFADKNAGPAKVVNFTNIAISGGAHAGNYTLVSSEGTATAAITARELNLTNFAVSGRIYDATTNVPAGHGFDDDRLGTDDLEFGYDVSFDSKNVGPRTASFINIAISGGADAGNYVLQTTSGTVTAEITKAALTLTAFTVPGKVYDATVAVPAGHGFTDNRFGSDELEFSYDVSFDSKNVGTRTASFSNIAISGGADAGNYNLQTTSGSATAEITQAILTVSGAVAQSRAYDTTFNAVITNATLVGVVPGDDVDLETPTTGTFASPEIGIGIAVTANLAITGTDAPNYTLTQPTGLTADIFPAALGELVLSGFPSGPFNAGTELSPTVTVYDIYGHVKTNYEGTIAFSFVGDDDEQATLPSEFTFAAGDAGVKTFTNGLVLRTVGTYAIKVADVNSEPEISATQTNIVVRPSILVNLRIDGATTMVAGEIQEITLSARDAFGNIVTAYEGLRYVRFTGANPSPDGDAPRVIGDWGEQAVFGDSTLATFVQGEWSIDMQLFRAEEALIWAQATISPGGTGFNSTGHELPVTVQPAAANKLVWSTEPPETEQEGNVWAGSPAVTVADAFGNPTPPDTEVSVVLVPSAGGFNAAAAVDSVAGVATFVGLVFDGATGNITLQAQAAGLIASPARTVFIEDGSAWYRFRKAHFSAEQLLDPAITGVLAVSDGAPFPLGFVFFFGAEPGHYTLGEVIHMSIDPVTRLSSWTFIAVEDHSGLVVDYQISHHPAHGYTSLTDPATQVSSTPVDGMPGYVQITVTDDTAVAIGSPRFFRITLSAPGGE